MGELIAVRRGAPLRAGLDPAGAARGAEKAGPAAEAGAAGEIGPEPRAARLMNVGVLLAAGASRRMGRTKSLGALARAELLRPRRAPPVVGVRRGGGGAGRRRPAVRAAAEAEFVALVGRGALHDDPAGARGRLRRHGARALEVHFVVNPRWRPACWDPRAHGAGRGGPHEAGGNPAPAGGSSRPPLRDGAGAGGGDAGGARLVRRSREGCARAHRRLPTRWSRASVAGAATRWPSRRPWRAR